MYPRLLIDLNKIEHNLNTITTKVKNAGCTIAIVTKAICADEKIIDIVEHNNNVDFLADSRIENIESYSNSQKQKLLLRLPMISDVARVVRFSDISLNSEIETIKALDYEASIQNKKHKIVLMIDLGDLREGIFYENKDKIFDMVSEIINLKNIELYGLGVNLTCYGAVIPQPDNLGRLVEIARKIERKFDIKLEMISGGNSSSLHLIDKNILPDGINNLRIGEALYLANETAYSSKINDMHDDAIMLQAEIIEIQTKPSLPIGEIGVDAFGNKPYYEDKGIIKRAILAVGKQDIDIESIMPIDDKLEILGASSDHLIINMSLSDNEYAVGDVISFKLGYASLLKSFTSKYVKRKYLV